MIDRAEIKKRLLIVDDESEILRALTRLFRKDYQVYVANSGHEGLARLKENEISVVISDQRMPGLTGSEFLHKARGVSPHAIRLMLTGYADINAVIESINNGEVFRYIAKPWDPLELKTIVKEAFEKHELIVQNEALIKELQELNEELNERVLKRTKELSEANENLQKLNVVKDKFLGFAAHDLRNSVNGIVGAVQLLLGEASDWEYREEFLRLIDKTSHNMLELINSLLTVTAIEQGVVDLKPQLVELHKYLSDIVKFNRVVAGTKRIQLQFETNNIPEFAVIDPARVNQVLDNLLSNAFKFSHPETTVTLRVAREDKRLKFAVIDQGQGIRAEELSELFQDFQRTSTISTAGEASIGLGLAICRRLIELHGGKIQVESVWEKGSTFSFDLPLNLRPRK